MRIGEKIIILTSGTWRPSSVGAVVRKPRRAK